MFGRFVLGLTFGAIGASAYAQTAEYFGSHTWNASGIGGMSGIEVSDDGIGFWALNDKGKLLAGQLVRDGEGRISGVNAGPLQAIMFFEHGVPLNKPHSDSEGLAMDAHGRLFVSFENIPRVRGIDPQTLGTLWIPGPAEFTDLQRNSGLEALAVDASGALYMLPERSGALTRPFPVYRVQNRVWDIPFHIPRRGQFLPVGADFGPMGRFFLLERDFRGYAGFRTRVRMFVIEDDALASETTLLETRLPLHDNLEGLSVWRDATGQIRLTMISDDNFQFLQRTEIVEYRLVE